MPTTRARAGARCSTSLVTAAAKAKAAVECPDGNDSWSLSQPRPNSTFQGSSESTRGRARPNPALSAFVISPDTVIEGLDTVPPDDRPPVTIVHLAFDVMVGAGSALMLLALWFGWSWWRRRDLPSTVWFLRAAAIGGALAIVATWAGWIVTEVGRQPWVVYDSLRTEDAVTETEGLWWVFAATVTLYVAVVAAGALVLRRMAARWREADRELRAPYGPRVST